MSDIALVFDTVAMFADVQLVSGDLQPDHGLQTAVMLSLFCHATAMTDDIASGNDRRGYWADAFNGINGDIFGSRLWLLEREKRLPAVLQKARGYALESLQWLLDDGVATSIDVQASWLTTGALLLHVSMQQQGKVLSYQFKKLWQVN